MDVLSVLHGVIGREGEAMLWWQMGARGVLIFLFGLLLVRLAGKRVFGKWGAFDIILSVIIGSNLSRALTGNAPFVETLAATAALVALHRALAAVAARVNWLGPMIKGRPARLIEAGVVDQAAMIRHGLGEHDLEAALRCAGVEDPRSVSGAWLERNGQISVVPRRPDDDEP
jgi:uncharacterized membrane protein YcaP (DUF421 family)